MASDEQKKAAYRRQMEEDYAAPERRRCHQCEAQHSLEALLERKGVVIQTFTGRVFCYPKCWEEYKRSEGL